MAPASTPGANERLGIPPVAFTDGPRGVISGRSTSFPVAIARAATWDLDLQRRVGDAIGQEARAQGANYWGGLCLNIVRHPSMGRAQETYGEDPWLTGEMGVAILEAVQRHNVMACAKHFALNSMETARFKNNVEIDERTLREVYLPHFRKAVEHDVATFMSAYNKVRGEWCGENRHLLTDDPPRRLGLPRLRDVRLDVGVYDGKRGVHAGLDIEMPTGKFYGKNLKALVERGEVPLAEIDESVRRIVRTKLAVPDPRGPASLPADPRGLGRARGPRARGGREEHGAAEERRRRCSRWTRRRSGGWPSSGTSPTPTTRATTAAATSRRPYFTSALKGLRDYLGAGATVLHADGTDLGEVGRVAEAGGRGRRRRRHALGRGRRVHQRRRRPEAERSRAEAAAEDQAAASCNPSRCRAATRPAGVQAARRDGDPRGVPRRTRAASSRWSAAASTRWRNGRHECPGHPDGLVFRHGRGPRAGARAVRRRQPERQDAADDAEGRVAAAVLRRVRGHDRTGRIHGYTLVDKKGQEPAFPFGYGLSYTTYSYANLEGASRPPSRRTARWRSPWRSRTRVRAPGRRSSSSTSDSRARRSSGR